MFFFFLLNYVLMKLLYPPKKNVICKYYTKASYNFSYNYRKYKHM